jgi:hypothetical protein
MAVLVVLIAVLVVLILTAFSKAGFFFKVQPDKIYAYENFQSPTSPLEYDARWVS